VSESEVSLEELMRYFIFLETGKTVRDSRELRKLVRQFCFRNGQVNPFGIYTVGYKSDRRNSEVRAFVRRKIRTSELFVPAVDSVWNPLLGREKGNLWDSARKVKRGNTEIPSEKRTLVCVQKHSDRHNGTFEVIDGFHRGIHIASYKPEQVDAVVGVMEKTE
jgi:hypothetical protein